MKRTFFKSYSLTPYPFRVYVSLGQSDSDFKSFADKEDLYVDGSMSFDDTDEPQGYVFYSESDLIMRTTHYPNNPRSFAVLQHEIFHVVEISLAEIGMTLTRSSAEAYAYLLDNLTEMIYGDMEQYTKAGVKRSTKSK